MLLMTEGEGSFAVPGRNPLLSALIPATSISVVYARHIVRVALWALAVIALSAPALAEEKPIGAGPFSGWKTAHLGDEGLYVFFGDSIVIASPEPTAAWGHFAGFHAQIYGNSWYPGPWETWRFLFDGAIGIDTKGILGGLAHEAAFGFRIPLSVFERSERLERAPLYPKLDSDMQSSLRAVFSNSPSSIMGRAGYAMRFGGDRLAYASVIELPRGELGWQTEHGFGFDSWGGEIRGHVALALVGRHDVLDGTRNLNLSLAWGGHLHFQMMKVGQTELDITRYELREGAVHAADARTCLRVGPQSKYHDFPRFTLCARERLDQGKVFLPDGSPREAAAFAGTITFGLGGE